MRAPARGNQRELNDISPGNHGLFDGFMCVYSKLKGIEGDFHFEGQIFEESVDLQLSLWIGFWQYNISTGGWVYKSGIGSSEACPCEKLKTPGRQGHELGPNEEFQE